MAYKLFTVRDRRGQDDQQWANRLLSEELQACDVRSLSVVFAEYLPSDGRIVEAGCGLGGWVKYLRDRNYDIIGIDCDELVVNKARTMLGDSCVNLGDVLQLGVPNESLVGYVSLGVIEHFEEGPQKALSEAFRAVKPGGLAFISVPANCPMRKLFVHPLRSVTLFVLGLFGKKRWFGEYRYNRSEITSFIQSAGFEIELETWDEINLSVKDRHIGIYADFPFFRDKRGTWRLNWFGQTYLRFIRLFPRGLHESAYLFVARKPLGRSGA